MKLVLVLAAPLALLGCASAPPSVEVSAPAATVAVHNQSPFFFQVSSAGEQGAFLYVLNATDPQKPHLAVYAFEKGRELELRAARTLEHDDLLRDFSVKGQGPTPEEVLKHWERTAKSPD